MARAIKAIAKKYTGTGYTCTENIAERKNIATKAT